MTSGVQDEKRGNQMKINELIKSFAICAAVIGCGDYQESQGPAVIGSDEEAITLKNSGWGVLTELSGASDGQICPPTGSINPSANCLIPTYLTATKTVNWCVNPNDLPDDVNDLVTGGQTAQTFLNAAMVAGGLPFRFAFVSGSGLINCNIWVGWNFRESQVRTGRWGDYLEIGDAFENNIQYPTITDGGAPGTYRSFGYGFDAKGTLHSNQYGPPLSLYTHLQDLKAYTSFVGASYMDAVTSMMEHAFLKGLGLGATIGNGTINAYSQEKVLPLPKTQPLTVHENCVLNSIVFANPKQIAFTSSSCP